MENISETVMVCMITIAVIQVIVIFFLIRYAAKGKEQMPEQKNSIIELLKPASEKREAKQECCN